MGPFEPDSTRRLRPPPLTRRPARASVTHMAITFAVDDVVAADAPRALLSLSERLGAHQALAAPVREIIDAPGVHPLLAAVHVAFAEHRPLVLSPDAIWLTIAQGVALHVRLNAERLRSRLVQHEGVKKLTVEMNRVPQGAEDWTHVAGAFRSALAELVGAGRARLFGCAFSTTTPEAAVAGDIVLMDVFSPYCDYEVACVCGIPTITLTGTPADWRAIRQRIDVIDELELGFWTSSLRPIADQLQATAEGRPDVAFWRDIYKPEEAYGWDRITGWIARLFPYLKSAGRYDQVNRLLEYNIGNVPTKTGKWEESAGIIAEDAPLGTSQVLITLVDQGAGGGDRDVILEGGLLGVTQDDDGRLEPMAGWLARPASTSIAAVLVRIEASHRVEPVRPAISACSDGLTGPADIVTLFRQVHEMTLFADPVAWHLRPYAEHEQIAVPTARGRTFDVARVLDLPDGSCVAMARGQAGGTSWVRLRLGELEPMQPAEALPEDLPAELAGTRIPVRATRQHAADVPVLVGTLADILTHALDTGGSPALPPSGETLIDIISPMYRMPMPTAEERAAEREAAMRERDVRRREKAARQAKMKARLDAPSTRPAGDPEDGER